MTRQPEPRAAGPARAVATARPSRGIEALTSPRTVSLSPPAAVQDTMAASPRRATPPARAQARASESPLISAERTGQRRQVNRRASPVARQDGTAQAQTRDGQHEQQADGPHHGDRGRAAVTPTALGRRPGAPQPWRPPAGAPPAGSPRGPCANAAPRTCASHVTGRRLPPPRAERSRWLPAAAAAAPARPDGAARR